MQMRSEIQIKSVIKALTDVVLPAVDANNKLAQEQLQLSIGLLGLMGQQLPVQFRFDCDELARLIEMSMQLRENARGGEATEHAATELESLMQEASEVLAAVKSTPESVGQLIRKLRSATGNVVTQTYRDGEPDSRKAVAKAVLDSSKAQLLRDRALLIAQGWEADPDALPDIETLLESR